MLQDHLVKAEWAVTALYCANWIQYIEALCGQNNEKVQSSSPGLELNVEPHSIATFPDQSSSYCTIRYK